MDFSGCSITSPEVAEDGGETAVSLLVKIRGSESGVSFSGTDTVCDGDGDGDGGEISWAPSAAATGSVAVGLSSAIFRNRRVSN